MSEDTNLPVAEAVVEKKSSGFSAVWLIPLVAVLIGAFLVYRTFADAGPTVSITFKTAEGLEAGKTKIRYKDVEVGSVTAIRLAPDLSHVIVDAELVKGAERYLTENTRFWVVRASVSAGRVTGLSTLLSGAYIGIDPSTDGAKRREFEGLGTQPVVTSDEPGRIFALRSTEGGSYEVGSPVFYRKIQVGEVVSSKLDESGDAVDVQIFVRAPHDARVRAISRFWNASGIDVSIGAEGVQVDTESLTSIMIGGISFDTPTEVPDAGEPSDDQVYSLYANRGDALAHRYSIRRRYRLIFTHSVEGLRAKAPVLFHGIQIGEVVDVRLEFDREKLDFTVPVLIEIQPERVGTRQDASGPAVVEELVERGLRARLASANLLTGAKQIELVMLDDVPPVKFTTIGRYGVVPTVPTPLEAITSNVSKLVQRISSMPIEDIGQNLDRSLKRLSATLENADSITAKLDTEIMPSLAAVSRDASALLSPDSTVTTELRQLLVQLNEAARSMSLLADYLERHPESLIQGKEGGS